MLVRTLAEDRAIAGASQEAQGVATLVAGVNDETQLTDLVGLVDQRSQRATSVLLPDGTLIGTAPQGSPKSNSAAVSRARAGEAFTLIQAESAQVVVPVVTERGTVVVRTSISGGDLHRGVATAWLTFAGLGAVLMIIAVVGADRLGRRVSAPVSELAAVAHRLRAGELDARAVPRAGMPSSVTLAVSFSGVATEARATGSILMTGRWFLASNSSLTVEPPPPLFSASTFLSTSQTSRSDARAFSVRPLAVIVQTSSLVLPQSFGTFTRKTHRPSSG